MENDKTVKNSKYPILSLEEQLKILNSFTKWKLSVPPIKECGRGTNYSIGFYLQKNGKILVKESFLYVLNLLRNHYKLRVNPNIFSKNYELTLLHTPKKHLFVFHFQFNKYFLGKSAFEVGNQVVFPQYFGCLEILELFLLNPKFFDFFSHKLGYTYILPNTYLINKKNKLDNKRCLCVYGIGGFLVLDRISIEYQVPWNNSLLINPIYI